jgi:hypothetical protein
MYIRNVVSGAWDKLPAFVSCLEEYEGALIAGDSIRNGDYVEVFTIEGGADYVDSGITKDLRPLSRMSL